MTPKRRISHIVVRASCRSWLYTRPPSSLSMKHRAGLPPDLLCITETIVLGHTSYLIAFCPLTLLMWVFRRSTYSLSVCYCLVWSCFLFPGLHMPFTVKAAKINFSNQYSCGFEIADPSHAEKRRSTLL